MVLACSLNLAACMVNGNCLIMLPLIRGVHWPMNQPAWGGKWVVLGKWVHLTPLQKNMHHQYCLLHSFQWCLSTKNIDNASHPSPPSVDNGMTPDSDKIPLLPPIQLLNSNAAASSWTIISEVSTSTNITINSIWDDDKIEKYKDVTGEKQMRFLWCNNSFSSWHATSMICHILKFWTGGLGACIGIIPKERYKHYQDFHDQNMNGRRRKNEGWISWWPIWSIDRILLQQWLPTLVRSKKDPHLSTCLCLRAEVTCRYLLMLE